MMVINTIIITQLFLHDYNNIVFEYFNQKL